MRSLTGARLDWSRSPGISARHTCSREMMSSTAKLSDKDYRELAASYEATPPRLDVVLSIEIVSADDRSAPNRPPQIARREPQKRGLTWPNSGARYWD